MRQEPLLEKEYEWLQQALNQLIGDEKAIIKRRYLTDDVYDYMVWPELKWSERTYQRKKQKALCRLAIMIQSESNIIESTGGIVAWFGQ
ncbi:ArpU family phage packaging/lysis transcriptional regulator [Domibacillus mangrovi]|nr:ArpU family phage packaging/lysis transcriptional regulator [Domibacillus mangrovi]